MKNNLSQRNTFKKLHSLVPNNSTTYKSNLASITNNEQFLDNLTNYDESILFAIFTKVMLTSIVVCIMLVSIINFNDISNIPLDSLVVDDSSYYEDYLAASTDFLDYNIVEIDSL